jgi:hypothetical protein
MYGTEKYVADAKKAGITTQLKADKFDEIRDAARNLIKAEKALWETQKDGAHLRDPAGYTAYSVAQQDVEDYQMVLDRFIQRAAEGDL